MMNVQKLNKETEDQFKTAQKYYQIISVINDLNLAKGQIQLIAFAAIRGNISDLEIREEYNTRYKTTTATIDNVVSKMKKKGVIVKDGNKIFVNPVLNQLNFEEKLTLVIEIGSVSKPTEVSSPKEETRESMELKNNSILNVKKYG